MSRLIGRRGRILVGGVPVTASRWTLDSGRDDIDMTMFGDDNKVTFKDLPNFTGDFEGVMETTEETIYDAAEGDAAVPIHLYPDFDNHTGRFWSGLAFLDFNVDTSVNDRVMVSGTWVAGGSWARAWGP